MSSQAASQIVVVLGAGPGLGYSVARLFAARGHPVALLSRQLPRLQGLAQQINEANKDQSRAKAYAVDATEKDSIDQAIRQIQNDFGKEKYIHTGVFNPGGGFGRGKFLDLTEQQLQEAVQTQITGGFLFSQAILRAITSRPNWQQPGPGANGNILITGATASVRGSANFAGFAAAKFGLRALGQSLAREYHPQGVHVAHFIIDGIIVTERTSNMLGDKFEPDTRMDPDGIAQVYIDTALQPRSVWAHEIDLRPAAEKF